MTGLSNIPLPFAAEPIVNVLLLLPLEVLLLVGRESEGGVCTVLKELGQWSADKSPISWNDQIVKKY